MYQRFVKFVEENKMISHNDKIVVGVSGGADSVCLLSLLCKYREKKPFDITVAHINHQIREEAKEDAEFVKNLCQKYELPFVLKEYPVEKIAKEKGMSTEEAGRYVRYQAFFEVLGNENGKIAVAHNKNDVAETVLFHLFRGSSSSGLKGICPKNDKVIRPILCFGREEIEAYLEENHLKYCIDKTNLTDDYTRNKIRNYILPYVEAEIVKGSISHIYQAADSLRQQEEYLSECVQQSYDSVITENQDITRCEIDKKQFDALPIFLKKRVLYLALERLAGSKKDITSKHIEVLLSLFPKSGMKTADLPYQLLAKTEYDKVILSKKEKREEKEKLLCSLDKAQGFTFRVFSATMPVTVFEKPYTKWFDYDKINGTLMLRTRQEGDFLMVQNGQHKKSLKRFFIDEKIPADVRDTMMLLADGSHIVWVVGKRISEYYKVSDTTKNILEVKYEGGQ